MAEKKQKIDTHERDSNSTPNSTPNSNSTPIDATKREVSVATTLQTLHLPSRTYELRRYQTAKDFLHENTALLIKHEKEIHLICASAAMCARRETTEEGRLKLSSARYLTVTHNGNTIAIVFFDGHFPPAVFCEDPLHRFNAYSMCASYLSDDTKETKSTPFESIQGRPEDVNCFLQLWCTLHPRLKFASAMHETTYALSAQSLQSPSPHGQPVAGQMRLGRMEEMERLVEMMVEFFEDVKIPGAPPPTLQFCREMLTRSLNEGLCYVWEKEGQLVSLVRITGRSLTGCRIGTVFTPKSHRRHGYSGALLYAALQGFFKGTNGDDGFELQQRQHVFLFADQANQISNHLYQKLGFVAVCEVMIQAVSEPKEGEKASR